MEKGALEGSVVGNCWGQGLWGSGVYREVLERSVEEECCRKVLGKSVWRDAL